MMEWKTTFLLVVTGYVLGLLVIAAYAQGQVNSDLYDAAISKADDLIKQGQFIEALSAAEEAVRLDNKRFTAYYYAAFALYRRDLLDEAERYTKGALERVSDDDRPSVEKLIEAISKKRSFLKAVKEGDKAFEQGLLARAAAAYTEAWYAMPERGDIGLKASQLWSNTTDPAQGAKILRQLVSQAEDITLLEGARALLSKMIPQLQLQFERQMAIGDEHLKNDRLDLAIKAFEVAIDDVPINGKPYLILANIFASKNNIEEVIVRLKQGIKNAGVEYTQILNLPKIRPLTGEQHFVNFLQETFGSFAAVEASKIYKSIIDLSGQWKSIYQVCHAGRKICDGDDEEKIKRHTGPQSKVEIIQKGDLVKVIAKTHLRDFVNNSTEGETRSLIFSYGKTLFEGTRKGIEIVGIFSAYDPDPRCGFTDHQINGKLELSEDSIYIKAKIPYMSIKTTYGFFGGSNCKWEILFIGETWTRDTGK